MTRSSSPSRGFVGTIVCLFHSIIP
ncbi:hypothetical protein AC789_1c22600 [Escherichia coli]|nr:hypothetical protein AC789_1c22600 [Escherichia coli]